MHGLQLWEACVPFVTRWGLLLLLLLHTWACEALEGVTCKEKIVWHAG